MIFWYAREGVLGDTSVAVLFLHILSCTVDKSVSFKDYGRLRYLLSSVQVTELPPFGERGCWLCSPSVFRDCSIVRTYRYLWCLGLDVILISSVPVHILFLTFVLSNPDMPCLCKRCRSKSVGFWRSQLIWIYTVCHSVFECVSTTWIK